jgi:hypothetical protein
MITTSTNEFCFTIKTAVGPQDVSVGIESKEVAKALHRNDGDRDHDQKDQKDGKNELLHGSVLLLPG